MMTRALLPALLCLLALSCAPPPPTEDTGTTSAPDTVLAIVHAALFPVAGPPVRDGTLVVQNGKILALGDDVVVPDGAGVLDARGASLLPGLVESHSHMGFKELNNPSTGTNNNELSSPINAQVRAIDGLNGNDRAFALALAAGITTMNITTGSRSPNSGQAVVVKLRGGSVENMFFAEGGMKFAIRATERLPGFPENTDEVKALLTSKLTEARAYLEAIDDAERSGGSPPPRDLQLEALGRLLRRERVVGVHAHDAHDMRHAIALKKEFDLDLFIHHANATDELVDELLAENVAVSFGPVLPFIGREDPQLLGPVRLAERGGTVAFHQDHPDGHQYFLRHAAALFVRRGMPEETALAALTLNGAKLFHVDDRVGSLEPGKDADFILLAGPPLDYESLVTHVFIDGRKVFDRATGDNVFGQRIPEGW